MTRFVVHLGLIGTLLSVTPTAFAQLTPPGMPAPGQTAPGGNGFPSTGSVAQGMESFDKFIPALLQKWHIPGAVVAVMKNDQLILSRGYGYSDPDNQVLMDSNAVFRLGQLSQTVTSATILSLVQAGKLNLDTPVFDILTNYQPLEGKTRDARLSRITIRHLLQHSGGWDEKQSFNPFDRLNEIAKATGQPAPPEKDAIVRYMMGQPLQFEPGTKSVPSDFGYFLLGKVIEKTVGSYEDYIKDQILEPSGAQSFQIGQTRPENRIPGEPVYVDYPGAPKVESVFGDGKWVARPDGGIAVEEMDGAAGWVASAPDYLKFLGTIDYLQQVADKPDKLSADTLLTMTAPPSYAPAQSTEYYGLGWKINIGDAKYFFNPRHKTNTVEDTNWSYISGIPGSSGEAVKGDSGIAWVALFNSNPKDANWPKEMHDALWNAVVGVTQWPGDEQQNGPDGQGREAFAR